MRAKLREASWNPRKSQRSNIPDSPKGRGAERDRKL